MFRFPFGADGEITQLAIAFHHHRGVVSSIPFDAQHFGDHVEGGEFPAPVTSIQNGDGGEIKGFETVVRQNAKGIIARDVLMEIGFRLRGRITMVIFN